MILYTACSLQILHMSADAMSFQRSSQATHSIFTRTCTRSPFDNAAPEALALPDNVVGQVGIHVCSSFIALLGHQVGQLLLVVISKVALPLPLLKPLHLQQLVRDWQERQEKQHRCRK